MFKVFLAARRQFPSRRNALRSAAFALFASLFCCAAATAQTPFGLVVSGLPDQPYIGEYAKTAQQINGFPVYKKENKAESNPKFRFQYIFLFNADKKTWVMQPVTPDPKKYEAHAVGQGDTPWSATWNPKAMRITPNYTQVIKGSLTAEDLKLGKFYWKEVRVNLPPNEAFVIEIYGEKLNAGVIVQDPRGGTVGVTEPVQGKGNLRGRFVGKLRGYGASIQIRSIPPSTTGDYIVAIRIPTF